MAGMLPGVECARRRRFHQSITSSDSASTAAKLGSTRRSSFCLYTSNRDFHLTSSSSQQRCSSNHAYQNEKLGQAAREAKERLDERLRTHRKPENSSMISHVDWRGERNTLTRVWKPFTLIVICISSIRRLTTGDARMDRLNSLIGGKKKSSSEEVGLKKEKAKGKEETTTKKRFSWGKLMKWKASEQEECTVCLERFRAVEPLVHLPCAHKFHSTCLVPWLQANAHCPCCRYPILAQ